MTFAICPTCAGRGLIALGARRVTCPECKGDKYVPATAAKAALVDLVSEPVVDILEVHSDAVVDWLHEQDVIGRTRFGLVQKLHRHDSGWGHCRSEWVLHAEPVGDDFDGARLWTVKR